MLFSSTTEVKLFFPIEKNYNFSSIAPYIATAQQQYILPILGESQLLDLEAAYNDGLGTPDPDQAALIAALRPALIQLALYNGFPSMNVRVTDAGIMKSESADYIAAPGVDVYYARTQLLLDGHNALDQLYLFLEQNASSYPLWANSTAFTQYTSYFIRNASVFNAHVNINGSRWLFWQFTQTMASVELLRIAGFLTIPFFQYLKTQFEAGTLTSDEQNLVLGNQSLGMPGLVKAIAFYTYSEAMVDPDLREQIRIFTVTRPEQLARTENPWLEYQEMAAQYIEKGDALMKQLEIYLNTNASPSLFPLWFTSKNYKDPKKENCYRFEKYHNGESKSSFVMF